MDKVERLMTLMATLLDTTRPLPVDEVRSRMGAYYAEGDAAFHRAFERDKEDLREMGIPISIDRIEFADPPADGYWIRRNDYYLRDPDLDPDELAAINVALSAIQLEGVQGLETIWKLGGEVEVPETAGDGGGAVPGTTLPSDPALVDLFGAVLDRSTATFSYRDQQRRVDPYRLDFRTGRWYLMGFDHDAEEVRTFRLDRLDGPVSVGRTRAFEPPEEPVVSRVGEPWTFGEGEASLAELWVDRDQAILARQSLGQNAERGTDDRGTTFEVAVTNWPAFRSFVLTLLDHAELLGPPELRDELIAWLDALARDADGADA